MLMQESLVCNLSQRVAAEQLVTNIYLLPSVQLSDDNIIRHDVKSFDQKPQREVFGTTIERFF